jgi:DNA modification methylase
VSLEPYLHDDGITLYNGDALTVLRELPSESIHCIATSPPFYGLRDYGTGRWEGGDESCEHSVGGQVQQTKKGTDPNAVGLRPGVDAWTCRKCGARRIDHQIGLEETPSEWAAALVAVFREARRVLRPDGSLWIECGDSYVSGQGGRQSVVGELPPTTRFDRKEAGTKREGLPTSFGERDVGPRFYPGRESRLKPKDLLGTPWLLAKALRDPYYTGRITSELDRVWLAAIVDGEGCIHIHKRPAGQSAYSKHTRKDGTQAEYVRTQDSYGVMVAVSNTDKSIIDRCQAITGWGSVIENASGTHGRKQRQWKWTLTGQQSRDVLRELYPHLMGKQRQARIAIGCPSSGNEAERCLDAIKALHNGRDTDVDYKPPASLFEPGFYLRGAYIWSKSNAMPESAKDRCTTAHSYVFQLSKNARYYFDGDAISEPAAWERWGDQTVPKHEGTETAAGWIQPRRKESLTWEERKEAGESMRQGLDGKRDIVQSVAERNGGNKHPRSVWAIPTRGYSGAHFATWPIALAERIILAGCPEWVCSVCGEPRRRITSSELDTEGRTTNGPRGRTTERRGFSVRAVRSTSTEGFTDCGHNAYEPGVVLDPFAGACTTLVVARRLGRQSVGIELNADYCAMGAERLATWWKDPSQAPKVDPAQTSLFDAT